jgi:hypothetical protein
MIILSLYPANDIFFPAKQGMPQTGKKDHPRNTDPTSDSTPFYPSTCYSALRHTSLKPYRPHRIRLHWRTSSSSQPLVILHDRESFWHSTTEVKVQVPVRNGDTCNSSRFLMAVERLSRNGQTS